MDLYLRETYPQVRNSVISSNGLYGAMVVQGMAMAILLREQWGDILLNETHPKVQYYAQSGVVYRFGNSMTEWLKNQMSLTSFPDISNEDEWDVELPL